MGYARIGIRKAAVPLSPERFDALLAERKLWGLPEIAQALGVSTRTARRWALAHEGSIPVHRRGGRWFAYRSQLTAWLQETRP